MKKFLFSILLTTHTAFAPLSNAQHLNISSKHVDTGNITITVFSNGYAYPLTGDQSEKFISEKGIDGWNDENIYFKIFFYAQQPGKIQLSLKTKSTNGNGKLSVQLDSTEKRYSVTVNQTANFVNQAIGYFTIDKAGYHYLQIKGTTKTGNYFPSIESLNISGEAAANIRFNTSQYRGAPSTHLWYEFPKDSTIAWFYNEVTIPVGINAVNAYYMTNGFSGGYMGIQTNSETERRIIFSVWSNYNTNDPKEIPTEYAVKLIKKGKDVYADDFGNEGSGGHSHLVFNWKNGETYKLLIGAKPANDHTIYTAYYFAPENNEWRLIAQWDKTKTDGKLLSGLYSFVENFGPNGNDYFKAEYGSQWVCTGGGTWIELTKCTLTTTASETRHPVFDYNAGVENNKFYMFTGGFKEICKLPSHPVIERKPTNLKPDINFEALPNN